MVPAAPIPSRVLVVRLGALGDVVNALVLATALKRARPDVEIGWAVHDLALPLVTGHPAVDRVHLWRRGGGSAARRAVLAEIRERRYDLAVDLQRILKSSFLARRSGAPRVLGWDRARAKELSWLLTNERIAPGPRHEHMVDVYRAFARHLGADGPAQHVLPTVPEAEAWADAEVARVAPGRSGGPVLVVPGASKHENRWDAGRFGEVAGRVAIETDAPVLVVGGPGDAELAARVVAASGGVAHDLTGATDVPKLVALTRRSRLVVTGDTGPMHVAVAVGTPVLAVFGPADPRRTGPYGWTERADSRHTVVRAPEGDLARLESDGVAELALAKLR
ncbi:MAG: glycosyltransferase family 9 protein [Planctomycetota bacterium]